MGTGKKEVVMARREHAEARVKRGVHGNPWPRVKSFFAVNPGKERKSTAKPTLGARTDTPEINLHYYGP